MRNPISDVLHMVFDAHCVAFSKPMNPFGSNSILIDIVDEEWTLDYLSDPEINFTADYHEISQENGEQEEEQKWQETEIAVYFSGSNRP